MHLGPKHLRRYRKIAGILAEKDDSEIVSLVVKDKKSKVDSDKLSEIITENPHVNPNRVKIKYVKANNPVEAILDESKEHDLIVMGFTRDPLIRNVTKDTLCHSVAQKCSKPMIIVKTSGGISSWIRRWL